MEDLVEEAKSLAKVMQPAGFYPVPVAAVEPLRNLLVKLAEQNQQLRADVEKLKKDKRLS